MALSRSERQVGSSDEIRRYFAEAERCIFTEYELLQVLVENKKRWHLRNSVTRKPYLKIVQMAGLKRIVLTSTKYRPMIRFAKRDASKFQIGLSLRHGGYVSHGSAAYLHGLSTHLPAIFINKEQTPKDPATELTQEGIHRAFARRPRASNLRYRSTDPSESIEYVLLNGKNTDNLGLVSLDHPKAGRVPVTNVARTLIDLSVRPQYGGGCLEVLRAFKKAKTAGLVEANELVRILKGLGHLYPYHQAIGFLMDKAGFTVSDSEKFKAFGLKFDFYLGHKIENPLYDSDWRIYYPLNLLSELAESKRGIDS